MKFKIKIDYTTGNSFGSEDATEYLDGTWSDMNIIEENLDRIEEHYNFPAKLTNWKSTQAEKDAIRTEATTKSWYVKNEYDNNFDNSIKLKLDNGKEYICSAFWMGYFESLREVSAELVMSKRTF